MDTGTEVGIEWNASEISASTSVFDITQDQSEEHNYSAMSELAFGSSQNNASCSTVPTQESIIADTLAAWEHEEFVPQNITNGKLAKDKASISKGRKRKHKQSVLPNETSLSETSENSINYSAIQSAVLLPQMAQFLSSQGVRYAIPNPVNNTSVNNATSPQNSFPLPHPSQQGTVNNNSYQSSLNSSRSINASYNSESQLNSTYNTSQTLSSTATDSSIQTAREIDPPLISSTQVTNQKKGRNSTLPALQEGPKKKQNAPVKEVKTNAVKGVKTKTKGTQVNVKTKAPKTNAPKKPARKKVVRKKPEENKKENNQLAEESVIENVSSENNNLNISVPSNFDMKSMEQILKEKVEELLNMPGTSRAVPDMNNTIGTGDMKLNNTINNVDLTENEPEVLVSQSCSIEIIKDANRASKINIILPPETNFSLSKNKITTEVEPKNNKAINEPIIVENDTPKTGKIKIKKEKISPTSTDITPENRPTRKKKEKDKKEERRRHSREKESPRAKHKHRRATPSPKTRRCTVACGYMSSSSSESEYSYDSSSCDCSDCNHYCDCSYCDYSSCSCSSCCSESSYESPCRRRRR